MRGIGVVVMAGVIAGCEASPSLEIVSQDNVDRCHAPDSIRRWPVIMLVATAKEGIEVSLSEFPNMPKPAKFDLEVERNVVRIIGLRPPSAELAQVCLRDFRVIVRNLPKGDYVVQAEYTIAGGTTIAATANAVAP